MNKKLIGIGIVIAAAIVAAASLPSESNHAADAAFHVTLASPEMYKNGVYSERITLADGQYSFRFVPNGDSPRVLSIAVRGESFEFSEDFELEGTLHQTGISEYHTWDYIGQKEITLAGQEDVLIEIDPNGNIQGPVSVYIRGN